MPSEEWVAPEGPYYFRVACPTCGEAYTGKVDPGSFSEAYQESDAWKQTHNRTRHRRKAGWEFHDWQERVVPEGFLKDGRSIEPWIAELRGQE